MTGILHEPCQELVEYAVGVNPHAVLGDLLLFCRHSPAKKIVRVCQGLLQIVGGSPERSMKSVS